MNEKGKFELAVTSIRILRSFLPRQNIQYWRESKVIAFLKFLPIEKLML
jgi:hypothetical protein